MNNDIKTMNQDDFKTQWQRSQHWQVEAEKTVPDDETLLRWVEKAQQASAGTEVDLFPFPTRRRTQWIPITAAASLVIGVTVIGLTRHGQPDNGLPMAKEVTVESQTVRFICNNGCSAQDIMHLANKVIK
jgi:hypothetical protein